MTLTAHKLKDKIKDFKAVMATGSFIPRMALIQPILWISKVSLGE